MKETLDEIEAAIEDIKVGKMIIVVDDEHRENEGDLIMAAEKVTPETLNFILTHTSGVICAPITEDRCEELNLPPMVKDNTCRYNTAFTVSVDLRAEGITTGISISDRARTIKALADPNTKPEDLDRPGHVFPLKAKNGGVIKRIGHTEAAVDFAQLAGLAPAGALCEIVNKDGSMARLPELMTFATEHNLKIVSIEDLVAYRLKHESP